CSCVRLTATLSTPGSRPRAFSMVPVQSEQCSPPIRARIFRRFGLVDGSSLHGSNVESPVIEIVIERSMGAVVHGAPRIDGDHRVASPTASRPTTRKPGL